MKNRKKYVLLLAGLLCIISGCSSKEFFQAIDADLGTDTQDIAAMIDESLEVISEETNNEWASDLENYYNVSLPYNNSEESKNDSGSYETDVDGTMTVHYLDVGQSDCTIIECNGEAMLFDAGDNEKGTYIQNYLEKQNISKLKYVIGSHPDADHYGGLDVIISKFECENIILPSYQRDTATVRDVYDAISYRNYSVTEPNVGEIYELGNAIFTILGPVTYDYGNEANNYSIAIMLQYGNNKFLFTGDAEEEAETDIVNTAAINGISLSADVYHVGHHGSSSSSSDILMQQVHPTYAVISCGKGNDYGHPHAEVLNRFRAMGIQVFRTDEQGTIIAQTDGTTITWNCAPSDSWQTGNN